ncbi:uncharacterized protein LOC116116139 [Pistacia vera]|uniref:uncharacterized protein LOC116116139 n=1 Tax=Pistacia vera TaxID=55513 RepID=UPI001262BEB6|nr:uncharacterized protein LOC116116139 [Pistacia vera]
MKTFLRGQDLWQYVEENRKPTQLRPNPTQNQIRIHEEEAAKAPRTLSHIHAAITDLVFTRIMACETPKEAWDKLRSLEEVTQQEVLESLLERFETKISSLEDSEDLSEITLIKLVHVLQAQEQRRLLRQEDSSKGAMVASFKGKVVQGESKRFAGDKKGKEKTSNQWNKSGEIKEYSPCSHCKKKGHSEKKYWFRPNNQYRACKQFGHIERVCKNKPNQPPQQAQIVKDQRQNPESEQLFVPSYSTAQQNGVSERKNRIVMEMARIKRCKLDDKAMIGIFISYSSQSKAYSVYVPKTNKIHITRDVKIDENGVWNWEENKINEDSRSHPKKLVVNQDDEEERAESDDDVPIRGTRPLTEICERCNAIILEPTNYTEAAKSNTRRDAMKEELNMIEKNNTWEYVDKPANRKVIQVKWIYKRKLNPDGSVHMHKARLVVKAFAQHFGVDFSDTFAPVARHDTIRLLLALAAQFEWRICPLDVKSTFLNGWLNEEIYVE